MKLIFFKVDNSCDYDRNTFDLIDNANEALEMLRNNLKADEWLCYNVDLAGLTNFAVDYNDELLDGGWWSVVINDDEKETPHPEPDNWGEISRLLMDTSEEKHLDLNLTVDPPEDMGLSSNDKLVIKEIWQDQTEGNITFKIEGSDTEYDLSDFPEFHQQIARYLPIVTLY